MKTMSRPTTAPPLEPPSKFFKGQDTEWKSVIHYYIPSLPIPSNPLSLSYTYIYSAINYFFDTFVKNQSEEYLSNSRNTRRSGGQRINRSLIPNYLLDVFLDWFIQAENCEFDLDVMDSEINSAPVIAAIEYDDD
jgi:hypothetical protein